MVAEGGAAPTPQSSSNPPSTDPAWAHGIVVDMARRKVQCKYCNRVLSGGVWRLKQHLAGIKGEVAPCSRVSAEVRIQFCQYMKEKETSKANISRRRQEIQEELSAPPRRSVDLPRGRQTIDLDDDDEEQFRRASQASRRSFAEEDYLRRTGHHLGKGSGHGSSGQGSSSGGLSTNIPEVPVDIPRDGDPRGVQNVLNVVEPLVRVLRAVDGERRSEMGYLYETMDRAKELIQMNNKTTYAKWWEIIDRRWEHTLHHDLHAAGHFFNPQYMYRTMECVGGLGHGRDERGHERGRAPYGVQAGGVTGKQASSRADRTRFEPPKSHRLPPSSLTPFPSRGDLLSPSRPEPSLTLTPLPVCSTAGARRPLQSSCSAVIPPPPSSPLSSPILTSMSSSDIGWQYGTPEGKGSKCNFCGKVMKVGGVIRLKNYLIGESGQDVSKCLLCPPEVRKQLKEIKQQKTLESMKTKATKERVMDELRNMGGNSDDEDEEGEEAYQHRRSAVSSAVDRWNIDEMERNRIQVEATKVIGSGSGKKSKRTITDFMRRSSNVKISGSATEARLYKSDNARQPRISSMLTKGPLRESLDIEEVFEEEHPLHAWVNATSSVEPEFDPHDRAWAEGELDDVPLLLEFETPPTPKRQKKTVGARGMSKKHGISIADLETIEEDVDDETPESSDNVVYQTFNDSTSKTSTPSEGSDHGGDVSSVPPPAPPPDPIVFTGEEDFTHTTQDQHHGSRQGREAEAQTSSQQYARKGKKVASQFQGQGQDQGRQASEDSRYNPNFIPHRRNWLMKKKKMQEWERQEKLRMEFETMEQASDTSSYASTEGYYQGQ
ncbi:hypothetical protein Taro_039527 [Colocasia esculenta]|uniref:BED-type domain-containing protein n=1 Tax=Colocasia esculenta TaxID=4460 RepID=A0A843WMH6_COLES|nr:hypothetical protein [Colocasia esculenta]